MRRLSKQSLDAVCAAVVCANTPSLAPVCRRRRRCCYCLARMIRIMWPIPLTHVHTAPVTKSSTDRSHLVELSQLRSRQLLHICMKNTVLEGWQ